jgi:hypothetical protein
VAGYLASARQCFSYSFFSLVCPVVIRTGLIDKYIRPDIMKSGGYISHGEFENRAPWGWSVGVYCGNSLAGHDDCAWVCSFYLCCCSCGFWAWRVDSNHLVGSMVDEGWFSNC